MRTRHDDPLVNVKAVVTEPGFLGEVSRWQPLVDAPFDDFQRAVEFIAGQAGIHERIQPIQRQMQGMQQQVGRFIPGVVTAVPEIELCLVETADGKAHQVAQGEKFVAGLCEHGV